MARATYIITPGEKPGCTYQYSDPTNKKGLGIGETKTKSLSLVLFPIPTIWRHRVECYSNFQQSFQRRNNPFEKLLVIPGQNYTLGFYNRRSEPFLFSAQIFHIWKEDHPSKIQDSKIKFSNCTTHFYVHLDDS